MLMGHAEGLPRLGSSMEFLLPDPVAEIDVDEEADSPRQILYMASFEELGAKYVQYDTIIWISISLLLVLACGIGVLMLLYLPMRRYVLRKEVSSRRLYVTPNEIVYKVSRPSFIPFWGEIKIDKHIPLSLVINLIIEQGCLQSKFGISTVRIESIAKGKAAHVDELQVQGVYNPGLLRKVVVTEASKHLKVVERSWKPTGPSAEGVNRPRTDSSSEGAAVLRSPSKTWKALRHTANDNSRLPPELLLQKLEEVNKSVKKIESLVQKSQASS